MRDVAREVPVLLRTHRAVRDVSLSGSRADGSGHELRCECAYGIAVPRDLEHVVMPVLVR